MSQSLGLGFESKYEGFDPQYHSRWDPLNAEKLARERIKFTGSPASPRGESGIWGWWRGTAGDRRFLTYAVPLCSTAPNVMEKRPAIAMVVPDAVARVISGIRISRHNVRAGIGA